MMPGARRGDDQIDVGAGDARARPAPRARPCGPSAERVLAVAVLDVAERARHAQAVDRLHAEPALDRGVVEQLHRRVQAPLRQVDDVAQPRLHLRLRGRVARHRRGGAGDEPAPGEARRSWVLRKLSLESADGKVAPCRSRTISSQRAAACSPTTTARRRWSCRAGEGCALCDVEGRRYLDMTAGIAVCVLGHGHPGLADAIAAQARRLLHVSNLYYSEQQLQLRRGAVPARLPGPRVLLQLGRRGQRGGAEAGAPLSDRRARDSPSAPRSSPSRAASTAAPWARSASPASRSTATASDRW